MKKIILTVLVFINFQLLQAQKLEWHTDVKKAIEISNKVNKPMLLFFTGSDWCIWCKRFQKEIVAKPEFISWANEKVVLVELDYPRKDYQTEIVKNQNKELLETFNVNTFPNIWFVKPIMKNEKVNYNKLGSLAYDPEGPIVWTKKANEILVK